MEKITILTKQKINNYIELSVLFKLTTPVNRVSAQAIINTEKLTSTSTISIPPTEPIIDDGTIIELIIMESYDSDKNLEDIQADLIKRYNEEQEKLNNSIDYDWYGITYDGEKWA